MNQSLPALLDAMRRVLRQEILPELGSEFGRSQLLGLLDILEKLERLVVWSPDVMREQLAAIRHGCAQFESMARDLGKPAPPGPEFALLQQATHGELEQDLKKANSRVIDLTDWLYSPDATFSADERASLESLMRDTIQKTVAAERRLVSRTNFSTMTGAPGD